MSSSITNSGLSGAYDGNIETNDVWSSVDGMTWLQVTAAAAFPARAFHTSVVFNDRLWVIGSLDYSLYAQNDVWSSSDGVNWTEATHMAAFPPRLSHASVVFANKLWIIGGRDETDNGFKNDVWFSALPENAARRWPSYE